MTAPNLPELQWRKSSRSNSEEGACVEVAQMTRTTMGVRDSKNPGSPVLALERSAWRGFLTSIKHG
jgi:hypothetical protein